MSRFVAVALLVLVAAVPAADAKRKRHKRGTLHGHVRHARAQAPKSWLFEPAPEVTATPTPTATPDPGATPTPTPAPASSLPATNPHSVSVGSTEYAFTLSQRTVSAGEVRIQFDNARAEDSHELTIDGADPDYWHFDEQAAGTVTTRTVTLRAGTYVLFCPILDHEARGMRATLTVR